MSVIIIDIMRGSLTYSKRAPRFRKRKARYGTAPSLYPKAWDSILFYFRGLTAGNFVGTQFIAVSAPADAITSDTRLINLLPYFTSYRVESIKAEITIAESPSLYEVIAATWDRDTPTNTLGTLLFAGTATYTNVQELQNFKVYSALKQVMTLRWKMNPSLSAHTDMRNLTSAIVPLSANSYQNGGIIIGAVADAVSTSPAIRVSFTYKVRLCGRKNL